MTIGFYNMEAISNLTTLSYTTVWRMVKAGTFPRPIKLSPGRLSWTRESVDKWMDDKVKAASLDKAVS